MLVNTFFRFRHNVLILSFTSKTTYSTLSFTPSMQSLLLRSFALHTLCYYSLLIHRRAVNTLFHFENRLYNTLFYSKYSLFLLSFTSIRACHTFFTPSIPSLPFITFFHSKQSLFTFFTTKRRLSLLSFTPSRAYHYVLLLEAALIHILYRKRSLSLPSFRASRACHTLFNLSTACYYFLLLQAELVIHSLLQAELVITFTYRKQSLDCLLFLQAELVYILYSNYSLLLLSFTSNRACHYPHYTKQKLNRQRGKGILARKSCKKAREILPSLHCT